MLLVTTTSGGTTTTAIAAVDLNREDGTLDGRYALCSASGGAGSAANVDALRAVVTNVKSTYTMTLNYALPAATVAGDVFELWNERGTGYHPDEVNAAINRAIEASDYATAYYTVGATSTFDRASPTIAIDPAWIFFSHAEWQDWENRWRPVPPADLAVNPHLRTVELRNTARELADGRPVRLFGYSAPAELTTDAATTAVDPEWIAYRAAYELALAVAHRAVDPAGMERKAQWWFERAQELRGKGRLRPAGPKRRLS